ncbi:hypothetical protein EBR96_06475, partial [bacterium]|nr:hypothetical protein [bacterium]
MVNIPVKELLSLITSALTIAAFVPYVRSILKRETRPHVLSWVIWAISTTTVFAAQLASGGGVGAWPTGLSGIITFGIAILAVSAKGELDIKPVDWACLFAAGAAIALWVVNSDPLWSVIIITAVDLLGFVPTAR